MMRSSTILTLTLLVTACSFTVGTPLPYEVIEEPVEFYFDTDSRDRSRVENVAETLEPHFPEMSWRIGTYEPSERDGIAVVVEERDLRDPGNCDACTRQLTAFIVYDRGTRIGIEEFEGCSIYRSGDDCFAVRRLVTTIRNLVATARTGPAPIKV